MYVCVTFLPPASNVILDAVWNGQPLSWVFDLH